MVVQSRLSPFWNLGSCIHPTFVYVVGKYICRWSRLSGVHDKERKISHTGGKCVTFYGLTNSREGQLWQRMPIMVTKLTGLLPDLCNDLIIVNIFPYCRNNLIKYDYVTVMLNKIHYHIMLQNTGMTFWWSSIYNI